MMTYSGSGLQLHAFLILTLNGGQRSPPCPGHFTPGVWAPRTHWTEGWVGLRAGLDDVEERKKSHHRQSLEMNPGCPDRSPFSMRYIIILITSALLPALSNLPSCLTPANLSTSTSIFVAARTTWRKIQNQNSGIISKHESIIHNFWSSNSFFKSGYYKNIVFSKIITIMITLLLNKVKSMYKIFKIDTKERFYFILLSLYVSF